MAGKRDRAIAYVSGLTARQLLDKCARDGNSPATLSQCLGLSGRGTPAELARNIARVYGITTTREATS